MSEFTGYKGRDYHCSKCGCNWSSPKFESSCPDCTVSLSQLQDTVQELTPILQNECRLGPMSCGNCGVGQFRLFSGSECVYVECVGCHSHSHLKPTQSRLVLKWGDDPKRDLGLPTVFEGKRE